jgi:hypothetical protein
MGQCPTSYALIGLTRKRLTALWRVLLTSKPPFAPGRVLASLLLDPWNVPMLIYESRKLELFLLDNNLIFLHCFRLLDRFSIILAL